MLLDEKETDSGTVAFIIVGFIAIGEEGVRDTQTVLIEGDRIIAAGPTNEVEIPADASVIDGTGSYLIPGPAMVRFPDDFRLPALDLKRTSCRASSFPAC